MKVAAAVTLYNPTNAFVDNIKHLHAIFDQVYVYDNTKDNSFYVDNIVHLENLTYFWEGRNDGLPKAFNRMLQQAYSDQIDVLCTLDQDSVLSKENVQKVLSYIENHEFSKVAAVGMLPVEENRKGKLKSAEVEIVSWIICSGCFLNLRLLKENDITYDEAYFIDRFDVDICMQIKRKGLSIIRLNQVTFSHKCGDDGDHSELRNYYIFRNRFYYNYKFYSKFIAYFLTTLQNLKHLKWVYSVPERKDARLHIYRMAKKDFLDGNMGEISPKTSEDIASFD